MKLLKAINSLVSRAVAIAMVGLLLISGYALWSNHRTYRDAEEVYKDLLLLKPEEPIDSGDLTSEFERLREVNSDIRAWLTVEKTGIDYPVVQAEDNVYYMSRNVYREPSLAGSIFLDARNESLDDRYLILYGHHMDKGLMFGDLDKFRDADFFESTRNGYILTEEGKNEYQVLAVADATDSVKDFFEPGRYTEDLSGLYDYLAQNALQTHTPSMEEFAAYPRQTQVVALVTCTSGQTGTRLVVFLYRHLDTVPDDPTPTPTPSTTEEPTPTPTTPDTPTPTPTTPDDPTPTPDPPVTGDSLPEALLLWLLCAIVTAGAFPFLMRKIFLERIN